MFSHNLEAHRQDMGETDRTIRPHLDNKFKNLFSHNLNKPTKEMREDVLTQAEHTYTIDERTCVRTIRKHLDKI